MFPDAKRLTAPITCRFPPRKPAPPQLIHARMYAQFAVIGGMAAAGLMTYWTSEPAERRSSVKLRLRQFDPEDDEAPAAGPADGASSDAAAAEQVAAGERA